MLEELFADGDSLLHRMDAKAKIISVMIFIMTVATTNNYRVAIGFIFLSLILATIARLPFHRVLKRLAIVNTFTIFLLITLPLTFGGEQTILFSGLELSREGIQIALLIALKTNASLIVIMALLCTSTVASLGHSLEQIGLPLRLCYLLLFSYRYIFVIEQEFRRLLKAARMRCFTPKTNIHTYRTYGYLFGMTLVKSWEQARQVHQAMVLRGFNNRFIPLYQSSMNREGYLLIFSIAMYSITLVILGMYHH